MLQITIIATVNLIWMSFRGRNFPAAILAYFRSISIVGHVFFILSVNLIDKLLRRIMSHREVLEHIKMIPVDCEAVVVTHSKRLYLH